MSHPTDRTFQTGTFRALPVDRPYDPQSQLILLEGSRGGMLARYAGMEPPRPGVRFYVVYDEHEEPFRGLVLPDLPPETVRAIAWPLPQAAEAAPLISNTGDTLEVTGLSDDMVLRGPGTSVRMSKSGVLIGNEEGGMWVGEEGVATTGRPTQEGSTKRGVTSESPLFGVLPKTAVTFFAADYLPDISKLISYASLGMRLKAALSSIRALAQFR